MLRRCFYLLDALPKVPHKSHVAIFPIHLDPPTLQHRWLFKLLLGITLEAPLKSSVGTTCSEAVPASTLQFTSPHCSCMPQEFWYLKALSESLREDSQLIPFDDIILIPNTRYPVDFRQSTHLAALAMLATRGLPHVHVDFTALEHPDCTMPIVYELTCRYTNSVLVHWIQDACEMLMWKKFDEMKLRVPLLLLQTIGLPEAALRKMLRMSSYMRDGVVDNAAAESFEDTAAARRRQYQDPLTLPLDESPSMRSYYARVRARIKAIGAARDANPRIDLECTAGIGQCSRGSGMGFDDWSSLSLCDTQQLIRGKWWETKGGRGDDYVEVCSSYHNLAISSWLGAPLDPLFSEEDVFYGGDRDWGQQRAVGSVGATAAAPVVRSEDEKHSGQVLSEAKGSGEGGTSLGVEATGSTILAHAPPGGPAAVLGPASPLPSLHSPSMVMQELMGVQRSIISWLTGPLQLTCGSSPSPSPSPSPGAAGALGRPSISDDARWRLKSNSARQTQGRRTVRELLTELFSRGSFAYVSERGGVGCSEPGAPKEGDGTAAAPTAPTVPVPMVEVHSVVRTTGAEVRKLLRGHEKSAGLVLTDCVRCYIESHDLYQVARNATTTSGVAWHPGVLSLGSGNRLTASCMEGLPSGREPLLNRSGRRMLEAHYDTVMMSFSGLIPRLELHYDKQNVLAREPYEKLKAFQALPGEDPDLIVPIGGDGYMMHCVRKHWWRFIPFYGVNAGHVGYLLNDRTMLGELFSSHLKLHATNMLYCQAETVAEGGGKRAVVSELAFNDAWIERSSGQTASIRILLNGEERIQRLRGDGVLVSTAAGSTAYSQALGASPIAVGMPLIQMVGSNVMSPAKWRPVHLDQGDIVEFEVLDAEKRPCRCFVDSVEMGNVSRMLVRSSRVASVTLAFSRSCDLQQKLYQIQFPKGL